MAYEPTEWKKGDVVTSQKLNKLEQGVAGAGGGALVLTETVTEEDNNTIYTLNKTYAEIKAAYMSGNNIVLIVEVTTESGGKRLFQTPVIYLSEEPDDDRTRFEAFIEYGPETRDYKTYSENGYPYYSTAK